MKKIAQIFLIISFLGILFAVPIVTKLQPHQDISKFEKRKLAAAPKITKEGLISGEYFSKWERYLSDHIVGRNYWIKAYAFMQLNALKKHKINNVVIGRDEYLLHFYSYSQRYNENENKRNIEKMVQQIKKLDEHIQKNNGKFYFVGIPEQGSFNNDKYPLYFNNNSEYFKKNEQLMFNTLDQYQIQNINMKPAFLKRKKEQLYYKTDHHYTLRGAYLTYYEILQKLYANKLSKQSPLSKDEFIWETLPNPFSGSRNAQLYQLFPTDDKIEIVYPKQKVPFKKIVTHRAVNAQQVQAIEDPTIYDKGDNSKQLLTYSVYMGGDHAEVVMKTHRKELPNILIFGDSYTNAIEPFIAYHFNETRILDLRYYKDLNLYNYISKYKPDIVLMVRDDMQYGNFKEGNGDFTGKVKE